MIANLLTSLCLTATASSGVSADQSIPALASSSGRLDTLVAAVTAANLVDALSSEGPFTVFAPSNEAFAKIPKAELEKLLDPKNVQSQL